MIQAEAPFFLFGMGKRENYYSKNKNELALFFIFIAVLFQPFIKISLGRDLWVIVDVVVAIFLLILALRKK